MRLRGGFDMIRGRLCNYIDAVSTRYEGAKILVDRFQREMGPLRGTGVGSSRHLGRGRPKGTLVRQKHHEQHFVSKLI